VITYTRATFYNPGFVTKEDEEKGPVRTEGSEEEKAPFCSKCSAYKPDRAHHCHVCNRCVKKYDHHCVWVNNCVGWGNYKFFFLLLNYGTLFTGWVVIMILIDFSVRGFAETWFGDRPRSFMLFVTGVLGLALCFACGFLASYHWKLILSNKSTVEDHYKVSPYDLGSKNENMTQVCGPFGFLWFCPVRTTPGSGTSFRKRSSSA